MDRKLDQTSAACLSLAVVRPGNASEAPASHLYFAIYRALKIEALPA